VNSFGIRLQECLDAIIFVVIEEVIGFLCCCVK
jgi:hypothetical protein